MTQQSDTADFRKKLEPLLPELLAYLHDRLLSHPLLIQADLDIERCAEVNECFRKRKAAARQALRDGNWTKHIWLHEKPYRFVALYRCLSRGLRDNEEACGQEVRDVWLSSENVRQYPKRWRKAWESVRLTDTERIALAAMRDPLPVFRGVRTRNRWKGLSWTLNRERALWFATRFDNGGFLVSGLVAKEDIRAYLTDRNEAEVIVYPERVRDIEITPVTQQRDGCVQQ